MLKAWRTLGGASGGGGADKTNHHAEVDDGALQLHDAFVEAIKDLTMMHETQKKRCTDLEQVWIVISTCLKLN